jgi:hypothetical protein
MLKLTIEGDEYFNDDTQTFEETQTVVFELEHSLLSVSKWESEYQKPFLSVTEKTVAEIFGYVKAMVITPNPDLDVLYRCSQKNLDEVNAYIDSKQSATTFGDMPERRGQGEVITSELIYYWVVSFNIPFECESWHLNRLFALIRICNLKNSKPKKIPKNELAQRTW